MTQNTNCTNHGYAARRDEAIKTSKDPAWAAKTIGKLEALLDRCKKEGSKN